MKKDELHRLCGIQLYFIFSEMIKLTNIVFLLILGSVFSGITILIHLHRGHTTSGVSALGNFTFGAFVIFYLLQDVPSTGIHEARLITGTEKVLEKTFQLGMGRRTILSRVESKSKIVCLKMLRFYWGMDLPLKVS